MEKTLKELQEDEVVEFNPQDLTDDDIRKIRELVEKLKKK